MLVAGLQSVAELMGKKYAFHEFIQINFAQFSGA
jgi:hypothetical protein